MWELHIKANFVPHPTFRGGGLMPQFRDSFFFLIFWFYYGYSLLQALLSSNIFCLHLVWKFVFNEKYFFSFLFKCWFLFAFYFVESGDRAEENARFNCRVNDSFWWTSEQLVPQTHPSCESNSSSKEDNFLLHIVKKRFANFNPFAVENQIYLLKI